MVTDEERLQLEAGYKYGSDHRYRLRCRAILLKSENLSNAEVARKLDVAVPSVFNWTKRYSDSDYKFTYIDGVIQEL